MKRILIGQINVDSASIVIADPKHLHEFDPRGPDLADLLPQGCNSLSEMSALDPPQLPFSLHACPVAAYSRRHGGVLGPRAGTAEDAIGNAVAAATQRFGTFPVYVEVAPNATYDGRDDVKGFDIERIVIDVGYAEDVIRCALTDGDVCAIADSEGVREQAALTAVREASGRIAGDAQMLVREKVSEVIREARR